MLSACSTESKLLDEVQKFFMKVLCPLRRPAAQPNVDLPGVLMDMMSHLHQSKVSGLPMLTAKTNARYTVSR